MQEKSTQIKSSFAFEKEQVPGEDDYDFNWEIRLIPMKLGQARGGGSLDYEYPKIIVLELNISNTIRKQSQFKQ